MSGQNGLLRTVATPIGNLGDLSPRAREALETADAIAAEDTRRTGRLLQLLGIPRKKMLSYFAPQESRKAKAILERLASGQTIVLVTDGGTPAISDPGSQLVERAMAEGHRVEPIPGPSAVTAALSASPEPADRFVFEGFLPSKAGARKKRLQELAEEGRTIVLFEAPHRLPASLADMAEILGPDRCATIVREVTKAHEEIRHDTLAALSDRFSTPPKGEIVIVLRGGTPDENRVNVELPGLLALLMENGLSAARAAREVARLTGVSRSRAQRVAESLSGPSP